MFVNGPPPNERYVEPDQCTTSGGWPVFDVVLAGLEGARTVYAIPARTDADYQGSSLSRPSDIAIGSVLLALTAISAGVGFSRVDACNAAIAESGGGSPRFHRRVIAPAGYAPPVVAPAASGPPPSVDNVSSPGPGERPAAPVASARRQVEDPE